MGTLFEPISLHLAPFRSLMCYTSTLQSQLLLPSMRSMRPYHIRPYHMLLQELLSDANPMVVANALASLQEIQEISGRDVLQLNQTTLMKLLTALNDCTEWGQVFILDSLAGFETRDPRDAEKIVERVLPRLQHVNSAVVLSAVKVRMIMRLG